jgi:hypothetical protein
MRKVGVVLGASVAASVALALVGAFYGWLVMLGVGIGHSIWGWSTIEFFPSAWGLGVISIFFLGGSSAVAQSKK